MTASSRWRRLLHAGTKIVFPDVCAGCGVAGAWICSECRQDVREIDPAKSCRRCSHPDGFGGSTCKRCVDWEDALTRIHSKYVYTGPVRQSIRKIKYHGEYARASSHGQELAELVRECGWSADVIVPVPLHPARLKRRGFNQSEKLARAMGDVLGWETRSSLRRVRNTPSQTELHEQERRINVYGAFEAGGDISGLRVLLVDDVATTCSTLLECAHACRAVGAIEVQAVVLATAFQGTDYR